MTGQNDRQDRSLTGQVRDQAGHCPLTGRYLQPWACPGASTLIWQSQPIDRVMPPWLVNLPLSSHELPRQWNQTPVTMIYHWKKTGGKDGGKRRIQRLNEERGCQETL